MSGGIAITLLSVLPALAPASVESTGEARATDERRPVFSDRVRDGWLVAIEGVTRAPIDLGAQIGVETPFGLRLFAGYGWVPEAYIGTLTGIAAGATGDPRARAVLDSVEYSGKTLRLLLGVRPFRKFGFYLDAGYAHVRLDAARDIPEFAIPGVVAPRGGYQASSGLELWTAELGYQLEFGRRLVLAAALGVTGPLDAHTSITPTGGAPNDPAISEGARQVDRAFERYGYLPTLTLRIGFDLI